MIYTPQQSRTMTAIDKWLRDPSAPQIFRVFGYAGTGKMQPTDCKVQTPDGPVNIGKLVIGDEIFGANGSITKVTGVFPQGVKQAYKISFRDKTSTEAGADHLWELTSPKLRQPGKTFVRPTEFLLKNTLKNSSGFKYAVPLCKPVEYVEKDYLIDPYAMGAFIGDGTCLGKSPTLCSPDMDKEVSDRVTSSMPDYIKVVKCTASNCPRYRYTFPEKCHRNPLNEEFKKFGLNVNSPFRFIPGMYMQGSIKQRIDLLRGLMDTDGTCRKNKASFSTMSEKLADDIITLIQSLGGYGIKHAQDRGIKGVEFGVNVRTLFNPFYLSRKAENWKPTKANPPVRSIVSVKPSRKVKQVCISVEAEDKLYLTDNFIVTHNTTITKKAVENMDHVVYASFTGKAALVMQQHGMNASTIHSLIYAPLGENTGRLDELEDQLANADTTFAVASINERIAEERRKLGNPSFALKDDSVLNYSNLLVIDECSMVSEKMAKDLMSFGVKILVLGDPFQLPPVKGTGYFTEAKPDAMLTDIRRQAGKSPIIRMATAIREGRRVEYGSWDSGEHGKASRVSKAEAEMGRFEQILTGKNVTRRSVNMLMRSNQGLSGGPTKGERLICLRNNQKLGLLNGMFATLDTIPIPDDYAPIMHADITTEQGTTLYGTPILSTHFEEYNSPGASNGMTYQERKIGEEFDFASCITVHKSQGSQFKSVLLYDDKFLKHDSNMRQRWLYTACTRSVDEFCWAD